ncbi:MAG TPA: geranylgeranyl reductase family protein [Actinomycetota bacterium]|nr:geranylgeranyl reductase family protein [Actinomycetota bacterium]
MSTEVDVAIVGGGPSGAAAAHYLASRGHSVLVCEKKSFPREKTCGDGLTPRAVKVLEEMGLGDELRTWERVQGLRVHAAGRTLELPFPELEDFRNFGLVKPRKELDQVVLDNAEAAGAKVLYKTQVHEPVFDRGVLAGFVAKRASDGLGHRAGTSVEEERVTAKWTVCAEGAATKFARSLGRERNLDYPMGLAIRQYFKSPMQSSGWFEAYLDVRSGPRGGLGRTPGKGDNLPGYGWVFPVGDGTVNAGVGVLSTFGGWRDINLHDLQRNFVSNLPEEWEVNYDTVCSKPRAGRLFMGQSVWPPHGPGFLLTGDAAGMINPCNGEGIAYAYETGRIAARHIDEALRVGSSPTLGGYTDELKETYGPYFRLGRRFVKLIGHPVLMEKLVSLGMHSKTVMSFALTLLANLEDSRAHNAEQKGLKALLKLAEWKP